MPGLRSVCAVLLAITLILPGANALFDLAPPPPSDGSVGAATLDSLRAEGLMEWIALGHVLLGIGLLVRRTRFTAGLLQLPLTLGIVAFNASMLPQGIPLAVLMLGLNVVVIADRERLRALLPIEPSQPIGVADPTKNSPDASAT